MVGGEKWTEYMDGETQRYSEREENKGEGLRGEPHAFQGFLNFPGNFAGSLFLTVT